MATAVPAMLLCSALLFQAVRVVSLQADHGSVRPHGLHKLRDGGVARRRTGTVDLDRPAWSRWGDVIAENRDQMALYFQAWGEILDSIPGLDKREWGEAVGRALPLEYFEEAYSIVKFLNRSGTTEAHVLLFSAMYELGQTTKTVDVLAASARTGKVVYGRNIQKALMAPLVEVTFVRGGAPLYTAPMFLGSIGVNMAIKPEMWTFGHTGVPSGEDTPASILRRLQGSAKLPCIMVRQYLDEGLTFREAVGRLETIPVARAQKFVLAGARPYQGVVISRTGDPKFRHTESLGPNRPYLLEAEDASDLAIQAGAAVQSMSIEIRGQEETSATTVPAMVTTLMSYEPVRSAETLWTYIMAPASGKVCTIYARDVGEHNCDWTGWDAAPSAAPEALTPGALPTFHAAVRPRDDSAPFSAVVPARGAPRAPRARPESTQVPAIRQEVRSGTWRDYAGSPEYHRVPT